MEENTPTVSGPRRYSACPFLTRLRGYQQVAKDRDEQFSLTDAEALQMMRKDCSMCGTPAVPEGHGITRLRKHTYGMRGMGPYCEGNTATACTWCNLTKGFHTRRGFIEICRHIATNQGLTTEEGDSYGLYDHRFVNNTSKRSRSAYLTSSKTFALSAEQFDAIVTKPCYYCGKESDPPNHYNGLDRLDSTVRVYTTTSCVSCCGTCNVAKYRLTEDEFLAHVHKVANYTAGQSLELM